MSVFCCSIVFFFFFKQKTAYEMRISDWSSDVCSSDLGTVSESGATETIIGVNVMAEGENAGTNTDFEGDYVLGLNPGTYTITYSFLGFQTKAIEGVVVKSGEATQVDVTMEASQDILAAVVVTASARENTESAVLNMQRTSGVVMDGLSNWEARGVGKG